VFPLLLLYFAAFHGTRERVLTMSSGSGNLGCWRLGRSGVARDPPARDAAGGSNPTRSKGRKLDG
jgi:hypothetical protein